MESNPDALGRTLIAVFLSCTTLMSSVIGTARALEYPSRPIRFVVQSPPGGGSDLLARLLGKQFTEIWGQLVVVDNRPGAGGMLFQRNRSRVHPAAFSHHPSLPLGPV